MTYHIRYSKEIDRKAFARFPRNDRERIQRMIEEKLTTHPEIFGKPMRHSLKGCRSLRVGEYRVIYRINDAYVDIVFIEHRSIVYKKFTKDS